MTLCPTEVAICIAEYAGVFRAECATDVLTCDVNAVINGTINTTISEFVVTVTLKHDQFRLGTLVVISNDDVFNTEKMIYVVSEAQSLQTLWTLLEERLDEDGQ